MALVKELPVKNLSSSTVKIDKSLNETTEEEYPCCTGTADFQCWWKKTEEIILQKCSKRKIPAVDLEGSQEESGWTQNP